MNFFNNCKTKEEAKKVFNKLAKHFHPDKGGDSDLMIELKKQYEQWDKLGNIPSGFDEYSTFSFNKIHRNSPFSKFHTFKQDIPFDHPIHHDLRTAKNEIVKLKEKLYEKERQIARSDISLEILKKEYKESQESLLELGKRYECKLEEIKNLKHLLENLKKFPFLEKLKILFGKNNEKQS